MANTTGVNVDEMAAKVLIIGAGKAGRRFLEAFEYLRTVRPVEIVGICDVFPGRVDDLAVTYPVFDNVAEALVASQPQIVCVCVNERSHFEVIQAVLESENVSALLCEKPLTKYLHEFDALLPKLAELPVYVNFVERYSPTIDDFVKWRTNASIDVFRMEFFWGKYRYKDERPTMGVLSEISHPIDLARAIAGTGVDNAFNLQGALLSSSDFSIEGGSVPESVDIRYLMDEIAIRGHSSFMWKERHREIIAYCKQRDTAETYQAVFSFDSPRWDQDELIIFRMNTTGTRTEVFRSTYDNVDFPKALDQIAKVARFCEEGLNVLQGGAASDLAVGVDEARWVQHAIESISSFPQDERGNAHEIPFDDAVLGRV